jgi:hypothetical protein
MTMKHFFQLTHKQYSRIIGLLLKGEYEEAIDKILEKCPRSSTSPLNDNQACNALMYNGNVLIDYEDELHK